ncbi:asparagine synthetase B family protein [Tropicibacter oceani]|uniref:Asparagine synthetase domain-containing protein n=1 Tax=Tropicibacter oceani TaxID=3058420 RepID=A0ABY8QIY2_9RHOB|nr:hypothetical protein [Tropicibacter oceani]WGW04494.1 hypothetical protein QF118_02795 [Tropicibacter oceani]
MSKFSITSIPTDQDYAFSRAGLAHYLRLGFLPAPYSVFSNELLVNDYGQGFSETADPKKPGFHRDLRQFVGVRRYESDPKFDEAKALDLIEQNLLDCVARDTEGYDRIFLMISGGKDSLSVAWALRELNKSVTLLHCTNRGREDETADVKVAAEKLGFDVHFLPDNIHDVDPILKARAGKLSAPIADIAFFSYVCAVAKIIQILDETQEGKAILLDGMGNDAYMGHICGAREKKLVRLPHLPFLSEGMVSLAYGHNFGHYALETLFKPREERQFSGAGFAVGGKPIAPQTPQIFQQYQDHPEERRALMRGGIFDVDCCMRKGVLAAELDDRIDIAFPFFDASWIGIYEQFPTEVMFDYDASFNKKLLRTFLKRSGVSSEFVFSQKGSFRFNLDQVSEVYQPSAVVIDLLAQMGIGKRSVEKLAQQGKDNFVAAQKYGMLYALDRFLQARDLPAGMARNEPLAITYGV